MFEFIQLKVIIILLLLKEFLNNGGQEWGLRKIPSYVPPPQEYWGNGGGEGMSLSPPPRARIGLGINNSVLKYLSHTVNPLHL